MPSVSRRFRSAAASAAVVAVVVVLTLLGAPTAVAGADPVGTPAGTDAVAADEERAGESMLLSSTTGQVRTGLDSARTASATATDDAAAGEHPITVEYQALGGVAGPLGLERGTIRCGLRDGGCLQHFEGGSIYWTEATGARAVAGDFFARWARTGWELGYFGYPVSHEVCGLRDGGCAQEFQGGLIIWSPGTGVRAVDGDIEARWGLLGWEDGFYGYPVTDARCGLRGGGCLQEFQGGLIYWTPFTGARAVDGEIFQRWGQLGWELGFYGYPVTDARCGLRGGGCLQQFQGGLIYWSPFNGARAVDGEIFQRWGQFGWELGYYGYPVTDARCGLRDGGCLQHFQGGSIYWTPFTGAQAVDGQIRARWGQVGWENGYLGYPVAGARCGLRAGGCLQQFQGGLIYWSPETWYAFEVTGPLRDAWAARGWEAGFLGYPVGPVTVTHSRDRLPTMYAQVFQGGTLVVRGGDVAVKPR